MQKLNKNLIATVTTTSLIVGLCAPAAIADADVTGGYDGWDTVVRRETSTPGGFSSVAEPAGPVDPEAAKRAAEKYRFHCVTMPKLVAIFDKTEIVTPKECTAQANTGAPLAAGPTTVSHAYEVTGDGYVIRLRTSWSARWRIAGQSQWHQVNGTVTTTETSSPFNLYFADSYGTTSN